MKSRKDNPPMSDLEFRARQDNLITHIDGPSRQSFSIPLDDSNERFLEIVYITLIWPITQEHIEDNMQNQVAQEIVTAVENELYKLGGGIIWWRKRPSLEVYNVNKDRVFKVYCRVATSPALPKEAWKRLHQYTEDYIL